MKNVKPYRPNVAAIVLSADYPEKKRIMLAERCDMDGVWQFPQGGIDRGESPKEALLRELEEEIGTNAVKVIAEYPDWLAYDFPKDVAKTMRPYAGQTQRYFLVSLKKGATINLDTKHPEFSSFKFVKVKDVFDGITHFKKPIYKQVIDYFKNEGYL